MNPLVLLLPFGLVAWYLSKGDSGKPTVGTPSLPKGSTASGSASSDKSDEPFVSRSEDYTDRNGVVWVLTNPFPSVWQGKVKNDPKGYPGYEKAWDESQAAMWQPKGSSRAEVVNLIDGLLALGTKLDIQPDIDAGKQAGLDDANTSIQAYKDSFTGYHVRALYPRWDSKKSKAWQDAYVKEFDRQLYRFNYKIESEGPCCDKWYIVKAVGKYSF